MGIMALIVTILLIMIFFREQILAAMSPRIRIRIESLFNLLIGQDYDLEGSSVARRIELQVISLRTFVKSVPNMIWGAGMHMGSQYYNVIGQHGFISDTIGAYGIIGIAYLSFFFVKFRQSFLVPIGDGSSNLRRCTFITFIIASFISSAFSMEVCLTAFMTPMLIDSIMSDEG